MNGALTRRGFLKNSIVATAALGVAGVWAAESATTTEKFLRWGVIGCGHRGSIHLNSINASSEQMQILAVCDVMEKHLAQGAEKVGGKAQTYTDYQKLLANPDINAVLIATPNMWHKEMILAGLQAGKHVMCEKPMAVSFDECKAIKSAVDASKQITLITMQLRYAGVWETMRKQIESGAIGKPKHLLFAEFRGDWNRGDVWQFNDPKLGKEMNWRFSHAASGGTLNEKVCHYFDILNWMVGATPKSVSCTGGISVYDDGRDTWDHANTTIDYGDGLHATHSLCMFAPNRLDLQIVGDEGSMSFGRGGESLSLQKKGKQEEIALPPEIRHGERGPKKGMETAVVRMYEDFLDCVKNNKKPWMDVDKAMASSKIAWLGELSSTMKKEVKWEEIS